MSFLRKDKKIIVYTAKECAFLAVFVAILIAVQTVLSAVPGVELVTVLFVSYSFVAGAKRGMFAATAFSLLRQLVFGFSPTVLILYLIYYNLLTLTFGLFGRRIDIKGKHLPIIVGIACAGTVFFTGVTVYDPAAHLHRGIGSRTLFSAYKNFQTVFKKYSLTCRIYVNAALLSSRAALL